MFEKLFQKYDRLLFFDTETTGFEPEKVDQIIELAAVTIDKDGTTQEMDEFIHLFRMPELPQFEEIPVRLEQLPYSELSDYIVKTILKEE